MDHYRNRYDLTPSPKDNRHKGWKHDPNHSRVDPITVALYNADPRKQHPTEDGEMSEAKIIPSVTNSLADADTNYQHLFFKHMPRARFVKMCNVHSKEELSDGSKMVQLGLAEVMIMSPSDDEFDIQKTMATNKDGKMHLEIGEYLSHPARSRAWFNRFELKYRHAFNKAMRGDNSPEPQFLVGQKVTWSSEDDDIPRGKC